MADHTPTDPLALDTDLGDLFASDPATPPAAHNEAPAEPGHDDELATAHDAYAAEPDADDEDADESVAAVASAASAELAADNVEEPAPTVDAAAVVEPQPQPPVAVDEPAIQPIELEPVAEPQQPPAPAVPAAVGLDEEAIALIVAQTVGGALEDVTRKLGLISGALMNVAQRVEEVEVRQESARALPAARVDDQPSDPNAEQAEAERVAAEAEQAEAERLAAEAERAEAERLAAVQAEADRLVAEEEAEAERDEVDRLETERAEAERLAGEAARAEAERLAAEEARLEGERLEAQRLADEEARLAAQREAEALHAAEQASMAAQREEQERAEAERLAAEEARIAAQRAEAEAAVQAAAQPDDLLADDTLVGDEFDDEPLGFDPLAPTDVYDDIDAEAQGLNAPLPMTPAPQPQGAPALQPVVPQPQVMAPEPQPAAPYEPAPTPAYEPAPEAYEPEPMAAYEPVVTTEAYEAAPAPAAQTLPVPAAAPSMVKADDPAADAEPQDLLYAIAVVDPEAEQALEADQSVAEMRRSAISADQSRKGRRQKQAFKPIPFDLIQPGMPLIAAVYSPSGGVGKSSYSTNLGALTAAIGQAMVQSGKLPREPRVLVLDGDIMAGSLAVRLVGEFKPNMHTLQLYTDAREEAGFTGNSAWPSVYATEDAPAGEQALQQFIFKNGELPNLDLLAAPDVPDKYFDFGPVEFHHMLQFLGSFYDVIIVDCGTEMLAETQRAWLTHAHQVFLITTLLNDRLFNAQKAVRYMVKRRPHPQDRREQPELLPPLATREKIAVVLSKADADTGLDPEESMKLNFGRFTDPENWIYVPDVQKEMDKAINTGRHLVLENQVYAKSITQMVEHMFRRYTDGQRRALPAAA